MWSILIVIVVMIVVLAATLWSAVELANREQRRAVFVFGEFTQVAEPGLLIIPPFVSTVESVPMGTQRVSRSFTVDDADAGSPTPTVVTATVEIVDAEAAYTAVDDYEAAFETALESIARRESRYHEAKAANGDGDGRHLERVVLDELATKVEPWGLSVLDVELSAGTPN